MHSKITPLSPGLICAEFTFAPGDNRLVQNDHEKERSQVDRVAAYVEGTFEVINQNTGEIVATREPGYVNSETDKKVPAGLFAIHAPHGGRYFCFFPPKDQPPFQHTVHRLKDNEELVLTPFTTFFLCMGYITVKGEMYGPRFARRVRNPDVVVKAESDVLALSFFREELRDDQRKFFEAQDKHQV